MAVNVKMGVDLGSFTSGIRQGQQIMKSLNAELKASEAEFKATGNAEQKMTSQTKTLNAQIQTQKSIVDQAQQALQAMAAAGIEPTDAAYQKLYATMMNATAGMNNAQAALNNLTGGTENAKQGADDLTESLQGIGKKISLEQVQAGIDKITGGLERAGKKAIEIGKDIWNTIMEVAELSDDIATKSKIYGMTPEEYQQYVGVFSTIADVTISDWDNARRKIEKALVNPSNDQIDIMKALGLVETRATAVHSCKRSAARMGNGDRRGFWACRKNDRIAEVFSSLIFYCMVNCIQYENERKNDPIRM